MKRRHWIRIDSSLVRLEGGSVLIGRNPDCDIVLLEPTVSRHHALVRVVEDGVEVVPLGRAPLLLNGSPVTEPKPLGEGDRLEVAGHAFSLESDRVSVTPDTCWFVERGAGVLVRVSEERVTVGSGGDDIVVEGWPPAAVALAALGDRLHLEALVPGVRVSRPLEVGEMTNVAHGELVAHGAVSLRVIALPGDPTKPTVASAPDEVVASAVLTCLPRAGRLALRSGSRERKVYLAGKRSELVALLLSPPAPYALGDVVPDTVIAERLWPGAFAGRTDINTLLWRVRKDFADAGLDRVNLFERIGGGLRVRLAPGARVEVHGNPHAE